MSEHFDVSEEMGWDEGNEERPFMHPVTGDLETVLQEFSPVPKEVPTVNADPEELTQSLLSLFPQASTNYVKELVRTSRVEFITTLLKFRSPKSRLVLRLALEHGQVTTRDTRKYGFDTIEIRRFGYRGIEWEASSMVDPDGPYWIYKLCPEKFVSDLGGRNLTSIGRKQLCKLYENTCNFCKYRFDILELTDDHRRPYDLVGDSDRLAEGLGASQLACRVCQNTKQKVCAKCPNKDPQVCNTCWWAYPDGQWTHVAMQIHRRLVLVAKTPEQTDFLNRIEVEYRAMLGNQS